MVMVFAVFLLPGVSKEDDLRITFLSVGQGDAVHIRTPDGKDWLIDAADPKEGSVTYYTIRPYLLYEGVSDIDGILLSHNDDDHSGAVPYLADSFDIDRLVLASAAKESYADLLPVAEAEEIAVEWAEVGDVIDLGSDVTLEVLWPTADFDGEDNAASLVVKLVYGDTEILFTGDVEGKGIHGLMSSDADLSADILKIPHHGSKNSYDESFYRAVDADTVVISVGKNSYGHPDDSVVTYWERHYADVYRTDVHGAVTVRSDGSGYTVTPYRNN
jgi:competence protein ComEC